jgi:16S rRNA (cytosine1402-N4)-methyltransferase
MTRPVFNRNGPTRGGHVPVMLRETLEVLAPRDGGIYLDGTFGGGGYSFALLEAADCRVLAVDRDPAAVEAGQEAAARYAGRLTVLHGCFGVMDRLARDAGCAAVDGVALDLGVSSMQLDQAERGFSYQADARLDMRMSGAATAPGQETTLSAEEVVNGLSEAELADIIYRYGEERRARQVARAIVAARRQAPILRTLELAEIVRRVVRRSPDGIDPATRTFQALRIYVNDELGELRRGLRAAERLLAPRGCLVIVAFQSLDDRVVKSFFMERSGRAPAGSRHLPETGSRPAPSFAPLFRGARRPSPEECAANPRARSARLRAARRIPAPAWADHDLPDYDLGNPA